MVVLENGLGLGQVAEHLPNEERVPRRLRQQGVPQRHPLFGHLMTGGRLHQREELVVAETT